MSDLSDFTEKQEELPESKIIQPAAEGHDARMKALEAIADQNEEEYIKDDPDFAVKDTHSDDPEGDKQAALAEDGDVGRDEPAEEETPSQEAKKYKIKVNGRDLELTEAELIARAQKVEAADAYLQEAARAKAEVEALRNQQPSREDVASVAHPNDDEEDAALVRAIQMGTEDEAKAALRKIREQSSVKQADVVQAIDARIAWRQAAEQFHKDYPDIANDDLLRQLAAGLDAALVQQGDKRPYAERYKAIGDQLRGKLNAWRAASGEESRREAKIAAKESVKNPPKQASRKVAAEVEEDIDDDTDNRNYIRKEAERRGQRYYSH